MSHVPPSHSQHYLAYFVLAFLGASSAFLIQLPTQTAMAGSTVQSTYSTAWNVSNFAVLQWFYPDENSNTVRDTIIGPSQWDTISCITSKGTVNASYDAKGKGSCSGPAGAAITKVTEHWSVASWSANSGANKSSKGGSGANISDIATHPFPADLSATTYQGKTDADKNALNYNRVGLYGVFSIGNNNGGGGDPDNTGWGSQFPTGWTVSGEVDQVSQ